MSNAVIDRDLLCRGCGYNLRGLLPTGSCPECATDIAVSLVPSSLSQSKASDFRLTDAGALMILVVCCWEIASKAGWILKDVHAAPGLALWGINLVCSNPRVMVLVSLFQVVALFAFSALARSQFRLVLLVLGLLLGVMEIPFAIGSHWDKQITVLAEAFIALIFYPQWLGCAADMARAAGDEILAKQCFVLRWTALAALALWLVGYVLSAVAMIGGGGAMFVLGAWMIPVILRLRTALRRVMPSDDWLGASKAGAKAPSLNLVGQDPRWLRRVHGGLVLACVFLCMILIFPMFSFVNSRLGNIGISTIPTPLRSQVPAHTGLKTVFLIFLGAAQLILIWWIASPPPREITSGAMVPQQWLRFLAAVVFLVCAASPMLIKARDDSTAIAYAIRLLAEGAIFFCFFLFVERDLAIRAGDEDVRQQSALLKWLLPTVMDGVPAAVLTGETLGLVGPSAALALTHLGRMLTIVFYVWAIWLIFWLSRSFARALATPLNPGDVI